MALSPGTRLGGYEVVSPLGAGGMGEVYRARDARLGRDVAIKVLPERLTREPESRSRFEREARLLASLNHSNIATLHGFEQSDEQRFLVMELVPGETLAARVAKGPLPLKEALDVCRQIAEALEAAHEKGILHRDLKPANVKVTPERRVKLLDFGLAKALWGGEDDSASPTASSGGTNEGVILGTAPYMSPEQARGQRVDKRSDIWSFGCVLYEALTGLRAFGAETLPDTLTRVLGAEPDWSRLPASAPEKARDLLRRCLQKEPSRRLHDIADARLEIEELLEAPASAVARPAAGKPRGLAPWIVAGASAILCAVVLIRTPTRAGRESGPDVVSFEVALPPGETLVAIESGLQGSNVTLSPDGRHLVYAAGHGQATRLYVRALSGIEARPLPGTEGAFGPFFSPDGRWVGFFTDSQMKKVALDGGVPVSITGMPPVSRGASWGPDGKIVFTPSFTLGLRAVSEGGGAWETLTTLDRAEREANHLWPEVLPGGKAVLFTVWKGGGFDDARIDVLTLGDGRRRPLIEGGAHARYVSTGHVLFARAGALLAAPFDLARLELTGSAFPVLDGVLVSATTGAAQFHVSRTGSLAYAPGPDTGLERALVFVDRQGRAAPLTEVRRDYNSPRLSSDGRLLAVGIGNDLWLRDLEREGMKRLTFQGVNQFPVWTPDGSRIAFSSATGHEPQLYSVRADGSGTAEPLLAADATRVQFPNSCSRDGIVAYAETTAESADWDVWLLPLEGDRTPRRFVGGPYQQHTPTFSPDGRWLAYVSSESGRSEVYVQPHPGPGGKWAVSTDGGNEPVWARSGKELFYRQGDKLMSVAVETARGFTATRPRALFAGRYQTATESPGRADYDVTADGQRFVMIEQAEPKDLPSRLRVVVNWLEALKPAK